MAELAGISTDWYVRLEQGRTVTPSSVTVDALACALRLAESEHAHLRRLARSADRHVFARERVPEAVGHLVQNLDQPAYVTGRRWDLLVWNAAAAEVFDFGHLAEEDCNILVYMLADPRARRLFGEDWVGEAKRLVAKFRTTHDLRVGDPAFLDLLERLRQGSPDFATWWELHEVWDDGDGKLLLNHPERGRLHFEYATFQSNDDPTLKLVTYMPV